MYHQFFHLNSSPFALTPDPKFLFLSESHREAIASLTYAVLSGRGISVLIGDAGTGKTTMLRALMRSIPDTRAAFSIVVNPTLTPAEFLRTCVSGFGLEVAGLPKDVILQSLRRFLQDVCAQRKVPVLILDEAQRLSGDVLEEVRLLTNFETDKEKLIHIILAGQDELSGLLDRYELRQLKQRVSTRVHIDPLTPREVADYIRYRWSQSSKEPMPFDEIALDVISYASGGIPRLINSICENALITALAREQSVIDAAVIADVAADLRLCGFVHKPKATTQGGSKANGVAHEQIKTSSRPIAKEDQLAILQPFSSRRTWRMLFGLKQGGRVE